MKLPRYFEDPATLHMGTEPNHAYFIPFKEEGMARLGDRLLSERITLLSGEWNFSYYPNRFVVPEHFMDPDFDDSSFDVSTQTSASPSLTIRPMSLKRTPAEPTAPPLR